MDWTEASVGYRRFLLTSSRSEGTAKTYVANLSLFWRWCLRHECLPDDADRLVIRSYIAERRAKVSSGRAHNDLASLRLFFAWLREERLRDDDPTLDVRVKRTKSLPTDPISREEMNALLTGCTDERDRLIVLMLAHTGARISELASLTCEDISWKTGEVRILGKGDKERRIAPNPDVLKRLRAYLGMFPSGALFLSKVQRRPLSAHQIRKILYDIAERARIDDIHPHRFRSFFATEYVEQFGDIQALQGVMGHESIETTARYSQYTRERRGLNQMRQLKFS